MGEKVLVDTDVLVEYVKSRIDLPEITYITSRKLFCTNFVEVPKTLAKLKSCLRKKLHCNME